MLNAQSSPVRLRFSIALDYEVLSPGTDFVFNIQAARTRCQQVRSENLYLSQQVLPRSDTDPVTQARVLRLRAQPGPLAVRYEATVDVSHRRAAPAAIPEVWVPDLPAAVLPYLYPSRYCESDRLGNFAIAEFGHLWQGYGRVMAIRDWVNRHVAFRANTSSGTTSACDTLLSRQGVCRDFAHLMIALCRAVNIPARFSTGIDYGADPVLGPPDFHAYVEAYLGGGWYLFDPSGTAIPMGFIRIATAHDAADAAFASIFGSVNSGAPAIHIEAIAGEDGRTVVPVHCTDALSTDTATA